MTKWLAILTLLIGAFAFAACGDDDEQSAQAPATSAQGEGGEAADGGGEGSEESGQAQSEAAEDAEALCLRGREEMLAGIVEVNEKYGSLSKTNPKNGVRAAQQAVVPTLEAMLEEAEALQADEATEEVFATIGEATEEVDRRNLSTQVPAFQEAFEPSSQLAREAGLEACAFVT